MKFRGLALLLAVLATSNVAAFLTASHKKAITRHVPATELLSSTNDDVRVPYDAAARLAYDAWRQEFEKGDFDRIRYQQFKTNYEALTSANMAAKKRARDQRTGSVDLLTLNEFGDFSAEEYETMQSVGGDATAERQPSTSTDIMGKAMKAVESQAKASSALGDAANALAEEEEKLANQLGFENVVAMEVAIDSMQGIASDGGELEPDIMAREARIRSAYIDWCNEFGKTSSESRFKIFYDNFLVMERFAEESRKEMTLNQFADCTEDEYLASTVADAKIQVEARKAKEAAEKTDTETKRKVEAEEIATAKAAEKAALEAAREKREKEMTMKRAEAGRLRALSNEQRKKATEDERKKRQAAQERAALNLKREAEAAAIAAVRAQQEQEAAQLERRRKMEEQAAEAARQKEREWQLKQEKLRRQRGPPARSAKTEDRSVFSSGKAAKAKRTNKSVSRSFRPDLTSLLPKADVRKTERNKTATGFLSTWQVPNVFVKPAPKPDTRLAPSVSKLPSLSLFDQVKASTDTSPATRKAVGKRPSFILFPPASRTAANPRAAPKEQPTSARSFSLFSAIPKTAPEPEKASSTVPAPVNKKGPSSFKTVLSLIQSPKPVPKTATADRADSTAVARKPSLSLLFSPSPGLFAKPAPAQAPTPATTKASAFSFGLGVAKRMPASELVSSPAPKTPISDETSPFAWFGALRPATKPSSAQDQDAKQTQVTKGGVVRLSAPARSPQSSVPSFRAVSPRTKAARASTTLVKSGVDAKPRPTSSLFGPSTKSPTPIRGTIALPQKKRAIARRKPLLKSKTDNLPVLSSWVRNANGSITGNIFNSKSFKNGTRITTSPIRGKASGGSIVKTGSGSQYRLQ